MQTIEATIHDERNVTILNSAIKALRLGRSNLASAYLAELRARQFQNLSDAETDSALASLSL
jgi:cell division inhibitor SulA